MADTDARAMFDSGARIQEIIDAGLSLAPIGEDYAAMASETDRDACEGCKDGRCTLRCLCV